MKWVNTAASAPQELPAGAAATLQRLAEELQRQARALLALANEVQALANEQAATDASPSLPARHSAQPVFERQGEYWAVSFLGKTVYLRHRLGFVYLEQLVLTPGKRWYCLELMPGGFGDHPRPACKGHRQEARATLGRLREQWQSLGEQLEEAERNHDSGRVSTLAAQREQLRTYMWELLRGPHGEAERARVTVHKAIRRALSSIQVEHPALADYLRSHLRLGATCSFSLSADLTG